MCYDIIGIGVDIITIKRIEKILTKRRKRFLEKVYTERELEMAYAKGAASLEYLTMAFAGKEAVFKALGTTWNGAEMKDIEILRDNIGRPLVILHGKFKELARKKGVKKIFLTLSSDKNYIIAFALIIGGGENV